jgi:hypothetical protein
MILVYTSNFLVKKEWGFIFPEVIHFVTIRLKDGVVEEEKMSIAK